MTWKTSPTCAARASLNNLTFCQDADSAPLVSHIQQNAQRYIKLFSTAVDDELPEPSRDITSAADILDVIQHQRREKNVQNEEAGEALFPPNLLRR